MPTPVPPNLSPLVQSSRPGSLTLITSVLDATSNWLLLRYLYAALRPEQKDGLPTKGTRGASGTEDESREDQNEPLNVVLVSFLRPFALWKEMAKKVVSLPTFTSCPLKDMTDKKHFRVLTFLPYSSQTLRVLPHDSPTSTHSRTFPSLQPRPLQGSPSPPIPKSTLSLP